MNTGLILFLLFDVAALWLVIAKWGRYDPALRLCTIIFLLMGISVCVLSLLPILLLS